ncbi:Gfo/Idh/MocA family oxidoreductase [Streptomyces sp. AJS327]|uniref:Gfo/Idh/MocA family oxidoreductase n=1 Tax=Streptomyces sp. AJS327 TaxID=2545265 RepID=UPI0015E03132|nr:Gfo/Idh/MocA family oxidoreductase [Streptomyces sp. AJS327]
MRIAVAGIGAIGSRHVENIREVGHQAVTVDCARPADYAHVGQVASPGDLDAWVVATPTETHLSVVEQILRRDGGARVLVEKPVCSPRDLASLTRVVANHPHARITVNDIYAHSAAVRKFAEVVREIREKPDPIRKVSVEFTKNRCRDVSLGRFVDTQYGEAGYEWFHILSVLRAVLPSADYDVLVRSAPGFVTPDVSVDVMLPGLPDIELHASTVGRIRFGKLGEPALRSPLALEHTAEGFIPFGSEFRYRFARVEFASGREALLAFEPYFGEAKDYRNTHLINVRDPLGPPEWRSYTITSNQLREGLLVQLHNLVRGYDGPQGIRLPEHRYLTALAERVRDSHQHTRRAIHA